MRGSGLGWIRIGSTSPLVTRSEAAGFRFLRCCVMTVLASVAGVSGWVDLAQCAAADEEQISVPPAEPSRHHEIYLRGSGVQRGQRLLGTIDDIPGDAVIFRTVAGNRERLRIEEIAELRFSRSPQWERGLVLRETGDLAGALSSFRAAMGVEDRPWALRELRGMVAGVLREQGQFSECVEVVQRILDSDPDSRHVIELPLVWDEQVPASRRMAVQAADLEASSALRRLLAASSLLGTADYRGACVVELRQQMLGARGTLKQLAEVQTWRCQLHEAAELTVFQVDRWQERSQEFARPVRAVAALVVAQADLLLHRDDRALEGLLWCGLVGSADAATTVTALKRAQEVMDRTGRTAGAAVIGWELRRLQPDTGKGRQIAPQPE